MRPSDQASDSLGPGPAFAEPWQARAFAIAVLASRQGCFTWSEWAEALGRRLRGAATNEPVAGESGYFDCWLGTLQALLLDKGAIGQEELRVRRDEWEDTYRHTPHGVPVTLSSP